MLTKSGPRDILRSSGSRKRQQSKITSPSIANSLAEICQGGTEFLNIRPYLQRYALNTTLTLCYGIRMDSVWDDMLREVLEVGSAISLLRSASENYQDYIPGK